MASKNVHEQRAARFLQRQGLKVIAHNFRCRGGEIDLICRHRTDLVFVEVRFRSNPGYASAMESVTLRKQRKLIHAARMFLLKHPQYEQLPCRFDVLAMGPANSERDQDHVQWLPNAFTT